MRSKLGRQRVQSFHPYLHRIYLSGWKAYFQFSETPSALVDIDA